jgi:cell division protein FtsN
MAAKKRRKKSEPAPGWAWMLFGLSIGLAVALVVFLTSGQSVLQERGRVSVARAAPSEPAIAERPAAEPQAQLPPETIEAEVADQTGTTELSFYDDLAASTVEVNEGEFEFAAGDNARQEVIIQAGSFPSTAGADSRRASLAFLGYESSIEHATVNGQTYHRVILGPFSDPSEINRTLRRLRSERIETVLRVATN